MIRAKCVLSRFTEGQGVSPWLFFAHDDITVSYRAELIAQVGSITGSNTVNYKWLRMLHIRMVPKPEEVARRIGKEYMGFPATPPEQHETRHDLDMYLSDVAEAFEVIAAKNEELFGQIPVEVIFQEDDPYDDYQDMADSVSETGQLRVFSGGDPHPLWDWDTEVKSRAVHDWFGHLKLRTGFDVVGEYRNWMHNRQHYPVWCERVTFTEVIGQLGAAYALDDGFADDRFEQKVFPAPAEWIETLDRSVREHGYVTNP